MFIQYRKDQSSLAFSLLWGRYESKADIGPGSTLSRAKSRGFPLGVWGSPLGRLDSVAVSSCSRNLQGVAFDTLRLWSHDFEPHPFEVKSPFDTL